MKVVGIITEYNPFHNGHLHHLRQAKKITGADYVLCIMNGNFMQRGLPAQIDKWTRTKMALDNGVDIVIELPVVYGTRSAEYFARGSVDLLQKSEIIDDLVFGSEIGQTEPLAWVASILNREPKYFKKRLKNYISSGFSYPRAREKALFDYIKNLPLNVPFSYDVLKELISQPNNILGLEYIKRLLKINSSITASTIQRVGNNYHSQSPGNNKKIASATALRKTLRDKGLEGVKDYLPSASFSLLEKAYRENKIIAPEKRWSIMLISQLRKMPASEFELFSGTSNGLAARISKYSRECGDFQQLVEKIKTRAFTRTRIQRILLHILLGITAEEFRKVDKKGPTYMRVLGFRKKSEAILSQLAQYSELPLITKPADYLHDIKPDSSSLLEKQLSYDLLASDLYTLLTPAREERKGRQDFHQTLIKRDP